MNNGADIRQLHSKIMEKYGFDNSLSEANLSGIIKESIKKFMENCKCPAIYCNGGHTRELMSDFIFELKKVKYIIDNYSVKNTKEGFNLISDFEIKENHIDGIIISSFKFRKEIAKRLSEICPDVKVLDIYDEIEKNGIKIRADYYYANHPKQHYVIINECLRNLTSQEEYLKLINELLQIKDVCLAYCYSEKLSKKYPCKKYEELKADLATLKEAFYNAVGQIEADNVLLLCLDGLRKADFTLEEMPKTYSVLNSKGISYERTYSYSTSTFESLIPVYSENEDMRQLAKLANEIDEEQCRFVMEAKKQGRYIAFYTDGDKFVNCEAIHHRGGFQSLTEKMWDFVVDTNKNSFGLFLIHELYESHYSFSNPYTTEKLLSEGTAMLFDFLPQKGGKLRADYVMQHKDAVRYIDDTLSRFLEKLKCKMLIYADHGNLVLDREAMLEELDEGVFSCSEEWTRVPFVICDNNHQGVVSEKLHSLMALNDAVICLMNDTEYIPKNKKFVKIARNELYNPDFKAVYKLANKEKFLQAFECFVFENGVKLVILSDGEAFLIEKSEDIKEYLEAVKNDITVCTYKDIYYCENIS